MECIRDLLDDGRNLLLGSDCEAVEYLIAKGTTWWLSAWFGPVYARETLVIVPAIGIFAVVDDDAGVEKARAESPQDGGEFTGLGGGQNVST